MLESPPAIVTTLPDVPPGFRIDQIDPDGLQLSLSTRCGPAEGDEVVVCGRRADPDRYRLGTPLPDPPEFGEQLGEKLSVKLGPIEAGSLKQRDGSRAFGARLRF
jgi:hypothetical protein